MSLVCACDCQLTKDLSALHSRHTRQTHVAEALWNTVTKLAPKVVHLIYAFDMYFHIQCVKVDANVHCPFVVKKC